MKSISYHGHQADTRFHDGALPYAAGAFNIQVMRANREHPELSQGTEFTYNHAPMICRWHGRLYLMYLSSPVHEHGGMAQAMLTSSADGFDWDAPCIVFPSIEVPRGVYCGKDPDRLEYPAFTVVHHRMGFYAASNGVLLVMTHHGVSPHIHAAPNSGYGMGRTVRRIFPDGSLGDIFVLRVNTHAGWNAAHFPYPMFDACPDSDFTDACRMLLRDIPANGAWWEEERLDEDFFPLKGMRAPSFCTLPDGKLAAVGKLGIYSISEDGGKSWVKTEKAPGVSTSGGKCCLTCTGDGRYALIYNPSTDGQHRWPLAAAVSDNGYDYDGLLCICGEVPPMRYGGCLKNRGPQYVRAIMPGNDDSPDGYTYLAYSMNKEDIWICRLPRTLSGAESEPVHDDFSAMDGHVPEKWHVYSPLWAQVRIENSCLVLRDSDPHDYAKAVRSFPESRRTAIRLTFSSEGSSNGELQMDVTDGNGMPAARLIFSPDGQIFIRGGDGSQPAGRYSDGKNLNVYLTIDCDAREIQLTINGIPGKKWQPMCPVSSVERLVLRTGAPRTSPSIDDELKNICPSDLEEPGERVPEAVYRIQNVDIE